MLTVITRESPLALLQVEELRKNLLSEEVNLDVIGNVKKISSYGDKHKEVSLMSTTISADFFTRELDSALLDGSADIAVHSAKDLPYPLPAGIEVIALTEGGRKSDSLVARDGLTLQTLPAGSRVGTSSAQRKAELMALRPDVEVVPIRGTIEERIAHVDRGEIDALIVASCALDRLGLICRATEELPFKTHPLQGNLAVTARTDIANDIRTQFSKIDIRKKFAKVLLVGFGPGDPELLTIKAYKALQRADAIFYDDLTNEDFLQQFDAKKVYVGKRSGKHSHQQDEINELLYQEAISKADKEDRVIVRLKGGDPMVFSHGREEIDYLQSRFVDVEVIPGISSGNAMASLFKIPLTYRRKARSVAYVLGHAREVQVPDADTLIYYMGGSRVSVIAQALIKAGRAEDTPAALITNVSLPEQKAIYTTLRELRYAIYKNAPVLIVVGEVVSFEAQQTAERVYNTGTQSDTPLIKIERNDISQPSLNGFDYIIFTSRYGVRYFDDKEALKTVKVISVGPVTTAALQQHGIMPVYESETESAEGIIQYFNDKDSSKILLPRSDKGLEALSDGLTKQGHEVADLPVYTNRPNTEAVKQDLNNYDKVVFTSPSTVEAFKELYKDDKNISELLLVAKGKTTYEAIQTI